MELQEQVKAYTAWINSQLKKRSQKIQDLGKDLHDGTVLISVIEIVSGHQLEAIEAPNNDNQKKENVVKVMDFMKRNGIKLHHVTAEEIVAGNVKTLMQLILALAAHFKPASIGGRKYVENSSSQPVAPARNKHKWKHAQDNSASTTRYYNSIKDLDVENDLSDIHQVLESLQNMLLLGSEGEPIAGCNVEEDFVIVQAQLDQANNDKLNLERELSTLQQSCRQLTASNAAVETRLKQQEEELLSLRQQLLRSNLAKDKLSSEKAELLEEMKESREETDLLRSKLRDKEVSCSRLESDIAYLNTEHVRALSKKEKEISALQQQQLKSGSPTRDNVFFDSPLRHSKSSGYKNPPRSPMLSPTPHSPLLRRASNSPTLTRRSPLSRHNPSRRRKTPDNANTRILYFTDREMTPAMTTIAKRVGDITLGEFKTAIKKHGNYRFIFKALDPELGTVKEEVFNDDDIIPGWEGKVVAWVEEELRV